MLAEGAIEIRNVAKYGILALKKYLGADLDRLLMRCVANDRQYENIKKVIEKGDCDINYASSLYGCGSMRGSSMDCRPGKGSEFGSAGGGATSYSGPKVARVSGYGKNNFGGTANNFAGAKSPAISKPIDPQVMEELKNIITALQMNDWQRRLKSIDELQAFVKNNQATIS